MQNYSGPKVIKLFPYSTLLSTKFIMLINVKHLTFISMITGFIRVREMSGKLKKIQGQGIVRELYVVSVKNRYSLKCQGNVREFYNFQFY